MKFNMQKGNSLVGAIVLIALIWGVSSLFSKKEEFKSDTLESNTYKSTQSGYSDGDYRSNSYEYQERENPYNDGSGHSAGYEWAQENNVSSCGGNSNSFIEGCEEYLAQQEESEN